MAAHGTPEYSVADGNDYAAHEQTYLNFLALVNGGSSSSSSSWPGWPTSWSEPGGLSERAAFVSHQIERPWETA
jgi:hypothetical protein